MGVPSKGRTVLAAAVLLLLLIATDLSPLGTALLAPGPNLSDRYEGPGTGPRLNNDPMTESIGDPFYYASLVAIGGIGTPSGTANEIQKVQWDTDDDLEIVMMTLQGFVEVFDPPNYTVSWRSPQIPGGANSLTSGDLDGDGHEELIVGGYNGFVYVYSRNSSTEADPAPMVTGWANMSGPVNLVQVIDSNNDSRPDVLVLGNDRNTLTYLLNEQAPSGQGILLNRSYSKSFIDDIMLLEVADIDKNGIDEILVSHTRSYYSSGLWALERRYLNTIGSIGMDSFPGDIDVLDIDNDNYTEIIVTGYLDYSTLVINGSSFEQERQIQMTEDYFQIAEAGDLDADGSNEIIFTLRDRSNGQQYIALYNYTNSSFEFIEIFRDAWPVAMASGDLNGNGSLEIVFADPGGLMVLSVEEPGNNNYTVIANQQTIGYDAFGLDAYDWDNDGTVELFVGSNEGYLSVIDPMTGKIEAQAPKNDYSRGAVIVADTNLDGSMEIITGNLGKLEMLAMNFSVLATRNIGYHSDTWSQDTRAPLGVGDIDQDGLPEILVGTEAPTIHVLNGTNMSNEEIYWGNNGKIRAMYIQDLDGNGYPEVVTGDTVGMISIYKGPELAVWNEQFCDYGPYGLDTFDVDDDGTPELLVGLAKGVVKALDIKNFSALANSSDLGQEAWGIDVADVDSDGDKEILVGTGGGKLVVLNGTTFNKEWEVQLGEWIGTYDSILVRDLDNDGRIEVAVGSDGFVYVLRFLKPSEKPQISIGQLKVPEVLEDGRVLEFSVPVTVRTTNMPLNVTVDFSLEPANGNVSGGWDLGSVSKVLGDGTYSFFVNWTAIPGGWDLIAVADPADRYSEVSELDNIVRKEIVVSEKYALLEWFAGQGTVLGRYHGLALGDDDGDGIPELFVSASEGFVQSYHVHATEDQAQMKEVVPFTLSEDLGTDPYGLLVMDVDGDGDEEVLVSTSEGVVYSFQGNGRDIEWRADLTDGPCFGLDAADIDQDGTVEVVSGCDDSRLYVMNGKDGRLERSVALLFELYAIDIADIGDDGKLDIIAASQDGNIYILSTKDLSTEYELKFVGPQIDDIVVGDIDHDGSNEIMYGDRNGDVIIVGSVINKTYPLGWVINVEATFSTRSAIKGVELADITKDPGLELIIGSDDGVRAYRARWGIYELIGNISVNGGLSGLLASDIDKDGSVEIVVGTLTGDIQIYGADPTYLGNRTTVSFTTQSSVLGLGIGLYGTNYGDFDGDGAPEIFLGTASGELRIYDGISKELELELQGMGSDLFGIKVADIDDDGLSELLLGSGDETVCAYEPAGRTLSKLWCSDKLGDWAIAFELSDVQNDNTTELVVASGPKVFILNLTNGKIMNSTYELGKHIIGLAVGELDRDPYPELVVGTEDGYLHIFNANNLTKPWGITLDSWPIGLAIADIDGDGWATIFAGTDSAIYEVSLMDREVLWEHKLGQGSWGLTVADFDADGNFEVLAGLRDGRVIALNASDGGFLWSSTYLGTRAGWYNSIKVADMDMDSQQELLVGSSGYLYLFGAGYVPPEPEPDAALVGMVLDEEELADGETTNLTVEIYDHSVTPIKGLTVHLLVDGVYVDSASINYLSPLERVKLVFPYTAKGGEHNITVKLDMYNAIHEYNEHNNEKTMKMIALGAMNLAIEGGQKGVRFSAQPIKGVEVTVFADIRNTGEEASGATIKFYWANLRLFGQSQVYVRGRELVVAAVNWTPEEAGDWDITCVIEPSGFDMKKDDNLVTRPIHILRYPSLSLASVDLPDVMVEEIEYLVPVDITNNGEATTTGSVALYVDGNKAWSSGSVIITPGTTRVLSRANATAGPHLFRFALEDPAMDDRFTDNELERNITIRTRPDMLFDIITEPGEDLLVVGKVVFFAVLVANGGGSNGTCVVKVYDNDGIFFEETVTLVAGTTKTLQVPWKVSKGDHNFKFRIVSTSPAEFNTNNNEEKLSLYVSGKAGVTGINWPLLSLLFVGILAPFIAALFYYSQVQPVREAARKALEVEQARAKAKVFPRTAKRQLKKVTKGTKGGT